MTFPASKPSCRHCPLSLDRGLSRCLYCGSALSVGRQPSQREQHETSRAAVEERQTQIVEARRTKEDFDRVLFAALNEHIKHTAEFTHDYLARLSGLNKSACQFALRRLQEKGIVRVTGTVKVRSNRTVPQWQFLLPPQEIMAEVVPKPKPAPTHAETVTTEIRTNRFRRRQSVA